MLMFVGATAADDTCKGYYMAYKGQRIHSSLILKTLYCIPYIYPFCSLMKTGLPLLTASFPQINGSLAFQRPSPYLSMLLFPT